MFRFGMQLVMPKDFEYVSYYGRGPVENYSNRNHSTDLGIYHQTVDEQFYPYIRPQRDRHENRHPLVESPRRERHGGCSSWPMPRSRLPPCTTPSNRWTKDR